MEDLKIILKGSLIEILSKILADTYTILMRQEQQITISEDGGIIGLKYAPQPDYMNSFNTQARSFIEEYDFSNLTSTVETHYSFLSEAMGTRYVKWNYSAKQWVEKLIFNILKNPPENDKMENSISQEIDNFINMITNKIYTAKLYFPIRNLSLPAEIQQIDFSDDLCVKAMSAEELTFVLIDPIGGLDIQTMSNAAAVVTYEDDIIFEGGDAKVRVDPIIHIEKQIAKLIHSLNLTAPGSKGIDSQHNICNGYFANFMGESSSRSGNRISGSSITLELKHEDIWKEKFDNLNSLDLSPFTFALDKLGDAETRTDRRDSIVDAIIGLESLLLNDIGNEKTRGELRYRFSINYSTLFHEEDKLKQYKLARDSYDIRSLIVHAALKSDDKINFQGNEIPIGNAKDSIIEMLRYTINLLVDLYPTKPFNKDLFWVKRVLTVK